MPTPTALPTSVAVRADHGRVMVLWQRFAAVPFALEATVAVVCFVSGITAPPSAEPGVLQVRGLVPVLLMVLSCLALLGIRRRPEVAWAVAFGCGMADILVTGAAPAVVVQAVVALFPIAVLRPTRTTVVTTSVTFMTYTVLAVVLTGSWVAALSVTAYIVTATAVGLAVRNSRRALVSAQLRAQSAEATREEEAQRRVAEERLRIAQELHDVIAHHVSVINVQSGVARHLLHRDPGSAEQALDAVREASRAALTETSQLVGLLRSDEDGLPTQPAAGLDRLDALVDATRGAGLDVRLQEVGQRRDLPPTVDLIAYRVVQEALTNALKHGAGSARLRVEHTGAAVVLDVRNPLRHGRAVVQGSGRGLIGMRERLSAVGGTLRTGPDDEGWFAVHAEIPLEVR